MPKHVLVFRTSVKSSEQAEGLRSALNNLMTENDKWNFDLEDCDHILRVESLSVSMDRVQSLLTSHGHRCEELPD